MDECIHTWNNYQNIRTRKAFKKCIKCFKVESLDLKPRLMFSNNTNSNLLMLDFWTPKKEETCTTVVKKRNPIPSHFIAWQHAKYNKVSVLNCWIIDHLRKIRKETLRYVYIPRPILPQKLPFLLNDDNTILDDYIKIVRTD